MVTRRRTAAGVDATFLTAVFTGVFVAEALVGSGLPTLDRYRFFAAIFSWWCSRRASWLRQAWASSTAARRRGSTAGVNAHKHAATLAQILWLGILSAQPQARIW